MLCVKCHQKEATVHITTIVDGSETGQLHLCEDCAPAAGSANLAQFEEQFSRLPKPERTTSRSQPAVGGVKKATRTPNPAVIGLVGDYDPAAPAHQAIPAALSRAAKDLQCSARFEWVPTEEVTSADRIAAFDGIWCVPASPYRSMAGALLAIRYVRENAVPFLGTCGGFQHAVIEYARNVLGWADAEHAETAPNATRAVISPLECALVETAGTLRLYPGTRLAAAYGREKVTEEFQCRYGINSKFQTALLEGFMHAAAADDATGEIRAIELEGHPFFVATLFQPERAALKGQPVPLARAFLAACVQRGLARPDEIEEIRRLFREHVPEVANGTVEVKAIARDRGHRSMLIVHSNDGSVDSVGACVGERGARVKLIVARLAGEHVDIVRWSENIEQLIGNAMGPLAVGHIELDAATRRATISLVGSRSNRPKIDPVRLRLASKVVGWDLQLVDD